MAFLVLLWCVVTWHYKIVDCLVPKANVPASTSCEESDCELVGKWWVWILFIGLLVFLCILSACIKRHGKYLRKKLRQLRPFCRKPNSDESSVTQDTTTEQSRIPTLELFSVYSSLNNSAHLYGFASPAVNQRLTRGLPSPSINERLTGTSQIVLIGREAPPYSETPPPNSFSQTGILLVGDGAPPQYEDVNSGRVSSSPTNESPPSYSTACVREINTTHM